MKKIQRHEIPVDGKRHSLSANGEIFHVSMRSATAMEVWWVSDGDDNGPIFRAVAAFAEESRLPGAWRHLGSAEGPDGTMWHLFQDPVDWEL